VHRPHAGVPGLARILAVRGRNDRFAARGADMHPEIIRAIINEHVRELSDDVRDARRAKGRAR